jgi:Tripartite ATP-independent periplasmic transporters, DctQ component.
MFIFCLIFALIAFQVVVETFRDDVQSMVLRIAVWPFQMIIPTAFFLTSIRHLIYTINPSLRPGEVVSRGAE